MPRRRRSLKQNKKTRYKKAPAILADAFSCAVLRDAYRADVVAIVIALGQTVDMYLANTVTRVYDLSVPDVDGDMVDAPAVAGAGKEYQIAGLEL